ncbi:hypothetical protein FRC02_002773 [Tulasnella sp. 418]|nr:hypothetical protein FRC02_002773 [Tulasnella sp. 418]
MPSRPPTKPYAQSSRMGVRREGTIKRESSPPSDPPTECDTTPPPAPPRSVRPLPRRATQSPITHLINRKMKAKDAASEIQGSEQREKAEEQEDLQLQQPVPGPSNRPGPSIPARSSGSQRPRQSLALTQPFRMSTTHQARSPVLLTSSTGRSPLPSTSDAFALPAVLRRPPQTSNVSRLPQVVLGPDKTHQEVIPSQLSTHAEPSSLGGSRRTKRKATHLDGEAPQPTRFSKRVKEKKEREEAERQLKLAQKKPEPVKRTKPVKRRKIKR